MNGFEFLTPQMAVLETYSYRPEGSKLEFFLLSLPTLKPIERCITQTSHDERDRPVLKDGGCEALVARSGLGSLVALSEVLTGVRLNGRPVRGFPNVTKSRSVAEDRTSFEMDGINSHLAHIAENGDQLAIRQNIPELCAGQKAIGPSFSCDCSILGSSTAAERLVAKCSSAHDNLFGSQVPIAQWLVAFRVSDLTSLGSLSLSKYSLEERSFASVFDGRLYLAQVTTGDHVAVYSVH